MTKPALTSSAAVLLVKDVVAAAGHYRDKLVSSTTASFGEPPSFCILRRSDCYPMPKKRSTPSRSFRTGRLPTGCRELGIQDLGGYDIGFRQIVRRATDD